MSKFDEVRAKKLSNFFGVAEGEIYNAVDSNMKESTLDDDESSNNSSSASADYNNFDYDSYYDLRILYNNWEEFENLRENFRESVPKILKNTDGMRTIFLSNEDNEIRSKSPIEDDFKNALRNLVKHRNEPWVNETTRIILNALRGVDSTINLMRDKLLIDINVEELYIELAFGIIINIVLETRENMGDCEINRLCYFHCNQCQCDTTYLFTDKEQQDICAECWQNST